MKLDDFNFKLPEELIAQRPASPRDSARLLVYSRADKSITDAIFRDLPKYLDPDTTLVLNQAKVDKSRLRFGSLEIFILDSFNDKTVLAMVRPGKKFKLGANLELTDAISAKVTDINDDGHRTIEFSVPLDDAEITKHRLTPLPQYIAQDESLSDQYQTVYAADSGSKAAPTAGLHFTGELLDRIGEKWPIARVTLDVGLGTFAPITDDDVVAKTLHQERYTISPQVVEKLNAAKHITAVGTTSTRVLESAWDNGFKPVESATTDIFIQPGDKLQAVDSLITNFHLPSTSLLMLVAAFTGRDDLMRIYHHAIKQEYRFYSFGDAMLIL